MALPSLYTPLNNNAEGITRSKITTSVTINPETIFIFINLFRILYNGKNTYPSTMPDIMLNKKGLTTKYDRNAISKNRKIVMYFE